MDFFGIAPHDALRFIHVLLFVYWLGGDLGVYFAAQYVANPNLVYEERMRFLALAMKLDMAPRTCLILMLPVGFQMTYDIGLIQFPAFAMPLIWVLSLAWLALMWAVHNTERLPVGQLLKKIDMAIRYVMLAGLASLGLLSLVTGSPIAEPWLALKILMFAGIIALGLLLRVCVAKWIVGFRMLDQEKAAAEAIITKGRAEAARYAKALWGLLILMAFLGVTKPHF